MFCVVTAAVCLGRAAAAFFFFSPVGTSAREIVDVPIISTSTPCVQFYLRLICQTTAGPQLNTVLNVDREKGSVICLVVYCVLPHEMILDVLKMVVCQQRVRYSTVCIL